MATLTFEQWSWLIDQLHHFDQDPGAVAFGFETDFLTDLSERFKEEGTQMFVSPRMMVILRRIGWYKFNMKWDDYVEEGDEEWLKNHPTLMY